LEAIKKQFQEKSMKHVAHRFVTLVALAIFLTSCATGKGMEKASQDAGTSQAFDAAFERVKPAALESMKNSDLGINIKRSYQNENGFNIIFNKSVSAFSWGSVGRVLVKKIDEKKSEVSVYSSTRWGAGTGEAEFAKSIFDGVTSSLAGKK
jgi:PBP1b-binding outer membrane lipoprotein LpoB